MTSSLVFIFGTLLISSIFSTVNAAPPSGNNNNCLACTSCGTCVSKTSFSIGYVKVTIDFSSCKNGTISWACCRSSSPDAGSCDLYSCSNLNTSYWDVNKSKCDELTAVEFVVPETATSITVQVHDGKFLGTVDCDETTCCGGSGTSCSGVVSGVCEVEISLIGSGQQCQFEEPRCQNDDDCNNLNDACAFGYCNVTTGQCLQQFKPEGTTCRPVVDLCDVPEVCTGHSTLCPVDLRKDYAYTYKCSTDQFLCGVQVSELGVGSSGKTYFLGSCGIGTARNFYNLSWPACVTQCIQPLCPNNRGLSNYALATCNVNTGAWDCTSKVNVGSPAVPVCPYY